MPGLYSLLYPAAYVSCYHKLLINLKSTEDTRGERRSGVTWLLLVFIAAVFLTSPVFPFRQEAFHLVVVLKTGGVTQAFT